MEQRFATLHCYLGAGAAFLGTWAVFTGDWTAIGWAVLLLATAWGKRQLNDDHLLAQAAAFAVSVLSIVYAQNLHLTEIFPAHIARES
jgi:hypothetical protein